MGVRTTRSAPLPNQAAPSLLPAIGRDGSRPSWRRRSACRAEADVLRPEEDAAEAGAEARAGAEAGTWGVCLRGFAPATACEGLGIGGPRPLARKSLTGRGVRGAGLRGGRGCLRSRGRRRAADGPAPARG